jgi:hypothetical protein
MVAMVTVVLSDGKGLLQVNRRALRLLHLSKTPAQPLEKIDLEQKLIDLLKYLKLTKWISPA